MKGVMTSYGFEFWDQDALLKYIAGTKDKPS
jgi:hypothetical protein